jgi:EmrB/QacA subfamily drug resistance transporter
MSDLNLTPTPAVSPFRKWGGLVVLSLALAIIIIDTTLLNVSLRTIINDLHTNIQSMQWVITGYSLILAALTITGGRLGDLYGRKRMFMLGAVIFAAGSLLASLSTSVGMLIWGESVIEGLGAVLMMPATAALLVTAFKGRDRAIAFGVWGGIAAAASAVGPILGGWLTSHYSWRWGFRINIIVVAILLLGSFLLKEARDHEEKPRLDFVGVALSALGLLSIVFGFIQASVYGWWKVKEPLVVFGQTISFGNLSPVPLFVLLGLVILVLFGLWQKRLTDRGDTPLVSLKLFKNQQFTSGAVTTGIMSLGQTGLLFSMPVFFQSVLNLDAFHTGLALLPLSLTLLVAAPASAAISKHIAPKTLIQLGLLANVAAFIVLRAAMHVDSVSRDFWFGYILFGLGFGMIMAQISNLTLSAVSPQEAGEASGVNNTLRQLGATLGSAVMGAILISAITTNLANGIATTHTIPESYKAAIGQVAAKQTSNVEFGSGIQLPGDIPPQVNAQLTRISHVATTDASRKTLAYGALLAALGLISSFWLPGRKDIEIEQSAAGH